ncbi:MAG: response regulator [Burkholderiales bacterium]|nr:response regulator [Burkholderiales bacterium]
MNTIAVPHTQKPTILIVDDTPANIGVLVDYLEEHDFRIVVAQDGEEALQRAQFAKPDLILLDVMMPGIDGFETCRRLKAHTEARDTPVIFMTALTETGDKLTGFEVGAVDYVSKPFQIEEVLARINTHLALRLMQRQLQAKNQQLQQEIAVRQTAEQSLLESYAQLKTSKQKQEELHQQLLQAEKMASIGQLAAGVAHEINNPIAFVNSNLNTMHDYMNDLLELIAVYERAESGLAQQPALLETIQTTRDKLDLPFVRSDLANLMQESLDGVQRVRRIVQDLRDFSHAGEVQRLSSDLHQGLDSTLNIVWNELKHKAKVSKEYGALPDIVCVPAQLNQVFMNLLINASHAVGQDGVISIRTGRSESEGWIEIADNGAGIAPENMQRIFEPFFTTKPVGQGTGLGLSLSYGIIQQHGGRIEVESAVGAGTTFRIWLPITQA